MNIIFLAEVYALRLNMYFSFVSVIFVICGLCHANSGDTEVLMDNTTKAGMFVRLQIIFGVQWSPILLFLPAMSAYLPKPVIIDVIR